MPKDIAYIKAKLTTLRSVCDELLRELEEETPSTPKQRQNKRDTRILDLDAYYNRLESKKRNA